MMRHVFVLIDGTSCTLASRTNIGQMYQLVEAAGYERRYQEGVGGITRTKWRDELLAPNLEPRAVQVYQTLVDMGLNSSDRLYIFGYSRGAVIARTLSMCIASKTHLLAAARISAFGQSVRAEVEMLCLFDPVVGWPRAFGTKVPNHEAIMEPKIKQYLELLSSDESRLFFPSDSYKASNRTTKRVATLSATSEHSSLEDRFSEMSFLELRKSRKVVWFPGNHGDVGGEGKDWAVGWHALATALEELHSISRASELNIQFPQEWLDFIRNKIAEMDAHIKPQAPSRLRRALRNLGRRWGGRRPAMDQFVEHVAHPLCSRYNHSIVQKYGLAEYPSYRAI